MGDGYFFLQIMTSNRTWAEYENKYKPMYQESFHFIEHYELLILEEKSENDPLVTISQIKKYGIESLHRVITINFFDNW